MKITHAFKKISLSKKTNENVGFLLSNRLGDYVAFFNNPESRYEGWFVRLNKKLYKVIAEIEVAEKKNTEELRNGFWEIQREISLGKTKTTENFFLPDFNSLVYENEKICSVKLTLDFKEAYDNAEFERFYEIQKGEKIIVVKCQNKNDVVYLAIKSDDSDCVKKEGWVQRFYEKDQKRNSPPFERYIFEALEIKTKKIVFSVAREKEKAVKEANFIFKNTKWLKKEKERVFKKSVDFKKVQNPEIRLAFACAQNALENLLVKENNEIGIYAGLPWFFQFWSRDEIISAKALFEKKLKEGKGILFKYLGLLKENGFLPNILSENETENSDGTGWLFKRFYELIAEKKLKRKEIKIVKKALKKTLTCLLKEKTENGLAVSGNNQTWMDSLERPFFPLEIQALRLNLYKLSYLLIKDSSYRLLEKILLDKVRKEFWNNKFLADRAGDFTLRANIFLAAYIYPELLKKEEWLRCFKNILPKLWLKWGGISTLEKTSPCFYREHSGENPQSLHQGDSWFYLNNLAALVLFKQGNKKFLPYINKIIKASTREILWQGIIGHHGELSSAENLKSEGCWTQAWSNALYIELIKEVFNTSKKG